MNSPSLMRDERGIAGIIVMGVVALLAVLGISAVAAVNWHFLLALFAMGIIGMAFVGVVFFKASPKLIMVAMLASVFIVVLVEVSFPVLVGGIIAIAAMWNMKLLKRQPLILAVLVITGVAVMIFGYTAVLLPMGIVP